MDTKIVETLKKPALRIVRNKLGNYELGEAQYEAIAQAKIHVAMQRLANRGIMPDQPDYIPRAVKIIELEARNVRKVIGLGLSRENKQRKRLQWRHFLSCQEVVYDRKLRDTVVDAINRLEPQFRTIGHLYLRCPRINAVAAALSIDNRVFQKGLWQKFLCALKVELHSRFTYLCQKEA